jgi:hypothetical protein
MSSRATRFPAPGAGKQPPPVEPPFRSRRAAFPRLCPARLPAAGQGPRARRQNRPASTSSRPATQFPDTRFHPSGTVPSGIAYVCNFESGDLRFAKDTWSRSKLFAICKVRAGAREEKSSKGQIPSLIRSGMLLGCINRSLAGIASEGQPEARKPVTKPRCPIDQNRGNENSRAPAAAHVIVSTPDDLPPAGVFSLPRHRCNDPAVHA